MIVNMRKLILSLAVIGAMVGMPALAQFDNTLNSLAAGSAVPSIEIDPPFPKPGQEITVSLKDYRSGSQGSAITWSTNGKELPEMKNLLSFKLDAPGSGEVLQVNAYIANAALGDTVVNVEVRPYYLDLVIEPQTRVLEFYLGRSLPSIGSSINATALIDNGVNPNNLIYRWRVNQTVLDGGATRGHNKVSFPMPIGNDSIISVEVSQLDGTMIAKKNLRLPSVAPSILFYEVDPLLGISRLPIVKSLLMVGNSATIKAEPYNLDSRTYNSPDISEWKVGNTGATTLSGNPYEITLEKTQVSGGFDLEFHVRNTKEVLQGAKKSIKVDF